MMLRIAVLIMALAAQAKAEAIKVTSGEHADFSRLVLALPEAKGWQLGRTAEGYELAFDGEPSVFDVSGVFDLIPKDRLRGLYADPATGNLQMSVDCNCHALPFSLDAKTIVIDLRDGPAPIGSSFETGLDGTVWPALVQPQQPLVRPRFRTPAADRTMRYNWLTADLTDRSAPADLPLPSSPNEAPMIREALAAQLAEAAARNVVDIAMPEATAKSADAPLLSEDLPLRLTGAIGLQIGDQRPPPQEMQPDGAACIPDEQLELAMWLTEEDMPAPYAGLSLELVGEFDRPNEEEVLAAAKRYLHLGFGAETRALLLAFPVESEQLGVLHSLSYLVDGDAVPPSNAFAGMEECDTAAALWAILSDEPGHQAVAPNKTGLSRAFSGLPQHLRTNLGPRLSDLLLRRGETDLAVQIREAMGRGPVEDRRAIALVSAEVSLAEGQADLAIGHVEQLLTDPGEFEADAIIALVHAQIAAGTLVEPRVVANLGGMLDEYAGDPRHEALVDAYILALAGSGQFSAARDFAAKGHVLNPVFWNLLAEFGTDDDLLVQVMLPGTERVPADAMAKISERLATLGFANQAAVWQSALLPTAPQTNDHGIGEPASTAHGASNVPAVTEEHTAGPNDDAMASDLPHDIRAASWAEDWNSVAALDDGAWGQLAQGLGSSIPAEQAISLKSVTQALEASASARALIEQVLKGTTSPVIP
jgi:hypothetical protein